MRRDLRVTLQGQKFYRPANGVAQMKIDAEFSSIHKLALRCTIVSQPGTGAQTMRRCFDFEVVHSARGVDNLELLCSGKG